MRISFFRIAGCLALSAMLAAPFVMAAPQQGGSHGKRGGKRGGKKGPVKKGGGRGVNK